MFAGDYATPVHGFFASAVNWTTISNVTNEDDKPTGAHTQAEQISALEAFLVGNRELEELEDRIATFNFFEAIGAVRREERHSDFLAFLLQPSGAHTLGASFLRRLLHTTLSQSQVESSSINSVEAALLDLTDVEVRREWENIDILVLSEADKLAILIENKVDSSEHSNQLARYLKAVRARYGNYRIIPIFLTKDASESSHPDYHTLGYPQICEVLKSVTERRASTLPIDVEVAIRHYVDAVERHMNPKSDIAKLAQKIYERHKRALDIIFEFRPDEVEEVRQAVVNSIERESDLILVSNYRSSIQFLPTSWSTIPALNLGDGSWAGHSSLMRFEVKPTNGLVLSLILGPAKTEIRDAAYDLGRSEQFQKVFPQLGVKYQRWNQLWRAFAYRKADEDDLSTDQRLERWQHTWAKFLDKDLSRLEKTMLAFAEMKPLTDFVEVEAQDLTAHVRSN